jgi:hypothetical protein
MTQQQLIQRLKQQSKQGMASSWESFFDGLISSATQLPGALIDLTRVITTDTAIAIRTLTGENEKLAVGFSQTFAMAQKAQSAVLDLAKAATFYESSIKSTSKSMGIGFNASLKMTKQFITLSKNMSGVSLNTKMTAEQFGKYAGIIKNIAPGLDQLNVKNQKYYNGLQQTNFVLDQFMGLSAEQASAFTQYAGSTAANSAQQLKFINNVSQILGDDAEGTLGYTRMITEGIAEAGADIQLQYGRLPGSLEVATIKASRLGLKLEDLAGAGESLLDIESSIGKELEYQLLTGRQLTDNQGNSLTNLYREATLRGNASDQADILTKIVQDEGKTLENNLFARKQMADLLGIQEQQLASAIQKQKIFEKAGEKLGITVDIDSDSAILNAAEALKEAGELKQEDLDKLAQSLDQRGTEDLLKQQLANSNEQLIMSKLQFSQNSTDAMRQSFSLALEGMTVAQASMDETKLKSIGSAIINTTSVNALATTLKGLLQAGTTVSQPTIGGEAPPANDLIATPTGYGDRILLAGEDTFALNNDDTVVAGTNLFPKQSAGNSSLASKMDELIAEIRTQTRVLSKRDNTFGAGINSAYYG